MKAVILAAGIGSRLRPLTDETPKSLLPVGDKPMLQQTITKLQEAGITEIAIVTGYMAETVKNFVNTTFHLSVTFIHNEHYLDTNTGYSLLLTKDFIGESDFMKFDADVVFESEILTRLLENEKPTCLCIDRNINLAAEEIKVKVDETGKVIRAQKTVPPEEAIGESIGIEKISKQTASLLFAELEDMMADKANWQEYYEGGYEHLMAKDVPFYTVDITGLKWVEIDSHEDYELANKLFS